ncbi:Exportin-4, partial [Chytridiales sp. JEL 0842]
MDDFPVEERQKLYVSLVEVLKHFAGTKTNVRSRKSDGEEELFEDLSVILETLTTLVQAECKDHALTEFVFFGLNTVIPLISTDLLKYPKLCRDYIKLVGQLVHHFPEKLSSLPTELLSSLLNSLIFGTAQSLIDVRQSSFEAITSIGQNCMREQMTKGPASIEYMTVSLDTMIEHMFNLLLLKDFDPDLIEPAGEALLSLALLRQATYGKLVHTLLEHQQTAELRTRLEAAFQVLTSCIEQAAIKSQNGIVGDK